MKTALPFPLCPMPSLAEARDHCEDDHDMNRKGYAPWMGIAGLWLAR